MPCSETICGKSGSPTGRAACDVTAENGQCPFAERCILKQIF